MVQSALEQLVEEMTLAELANRSGRSVTEIIEYAIGRGRRNGASRAEAVAASPTTKKAGTATRSRKVNTRTSAGRAAYAKALLEALNNAGTPTSAVALRGVVGGTPQQARATLNRLIETGKVSFQGKTRATKYSVR